MAPKISQVADVAFAVMSSAIDIGQETYNKAAKNTEAIISATKFIVSLTMETIESEVDKKIKEIADIASSGAFASIPNTKANPPKQQDSL
jgi:uncharacterized protein YllA (UPF0747 family)